MAAGDDGDERRAVLDYALADLETSAAPMRRPDVGLAAPVLMQRWNEAVAGVRSWAPQLAPGLPRYVATQNLPLAALAVEARALREWIASSATPSRLLYLERRASLLRRAVVASEARPTLLAFVWRGVLVELEAAAREILGEDAVPPLPISLAMAWGPDRLPHPVDWLADLERALRLHREAAPAVPPTAVDAGCFADLAARMGALREPIDQAELVQRQYLPQDLVDRFLALLREATFVLEPLDVALPLTTFGGGRWKPDGVLPTLVEWRALLVAARRDLRGPAARHRHLAARARAFRQLTGEATPNAELAWGSIRAYRHLRGQCAALPGVREPELPPVVGAQAPLYGQGASTHDNRQLRGFLRKLVVLVEESLLAPATSEARAPAPAGSPQPAEHLADVREPPAVPPADLAFRSDVDGDLYMFSDEPDAARWRVFLHFAGGARREAMPEEGRRFLAASPHYVAAGEVMWLVEAMGAVHLEIHRPGAPPMLVPHPRAPDSRAR